MYDYEKQMEARQKRRMRFESRFLDRMERLVNKADAMIGEIVRDGKTINYIWPTDGKYREGTWNELSDFLIRNKYVR